MPTFRVQGPDGKVYPVQAPEGATEQQAIEYIADTVYSVPSSDSSPTSEGSIIEGVYETARAVGSNLVRTTLGGLAGLASVATGGGAKGFLENVESFTEGAYEPETKTGKKFFKAISDPTTTLEEAGAPKIVTETMQAYSAIPETVGNAVLRTTGSPGLATLAFAGASVAKIAAETVGPAKAISTVRKNKYVKNNARDIVKNTEESYKAYTQEGLTPDRAFALAKEETLTEFGINDRSYKKATDIVGKPRLRFINTSRLTNPQQITDAIEKVKLSRLQERIVTAKERTPEKQSLTSKVIEPIYEVLGKIHPNLGGLLQKAEVESSLLKAEPLKVAKTFSDNYRKLPKKARGEFYLALRNGDRNEAVRIANSYRRDKLASLIAVGGELDSTIFKPLGSSVGDIGPDNFTLLNNYFPTRYADYEGLVAKYGFNTNPAFKKWFDSMNQMNPYEQANSFNKLMRDTVVPKVDKTTPSNIKERKIAQLLPDDIQFLDEADNALFRYIHDAGEYVTKRRVFGYVYPDLPQKPHLLNKSIGETINELTQRGDLSPRYAPLIRNILEARFGAGVKHPAGKVTALKNIGYMGTIGNVFSAITQIGDIPIAVLANGLLPVLRSFINRPIKLKDLGVTTIGQELQDGAKTTRWLDKTLKITGFNAIDRIGKSIHTNAAVHNIKRLSDRGLVRNYGDIFNPTELLQLRRDAIAGNNSELVKTAALYKLGRIQPIFLSSMPRKYLEHPNGRLFYALKSFTLTQLNFIRREGLRKLKTEGQRTEGLKFLLKAGTILTAAGASIDIVKDWIANGFGAQDIGKEVPDYVTNNILKIFGTNQYLLDQLSRGRPVESTINSLLPPVVGMGNAIGHDLIHLSNSMVYGEPYTQRVATARYVPVFSKFIDAIFNPAEIK